MGKELCLTRDIARDSVDGLVLEAIKHVRENGEPINARAGDGVQAFNVNYILKNPLNRVHVLRAPNSVSYLAREMMVYLSGTLSAEKMAKASKFWLSIQDEDGKINSNYGYYVFKQLTPNGLNQYEWVINLLNQRPKSRRPLININQIQHKTDTKDMPCTVSIQFFVQDEYLCCVVGSRSTDVITGLPYDQGFFSFLLELAHKDLVERGHEGLKLGYCMMKATFTQLYDSRKKLEQDVINAAGKDLPQISMPRIDNAHAILEDIANGTFFSETLQWCLENS